MFFHNPCIETETYFWCQGHTLFATDILVRCIVILKIITSLMITLLNQACIQLTNKKGDSKNRNVNGDRHVTVMTLSHYLKEKNEYIYVRDPRSEYGIIFCTK